MINIDCLLKTKHIRFCGNKYFGFYCISENGISKPCSIRIFGKRFEIPHKLRKLITFKKRHM